MMTVAPRLLIWLKRSMISKASSEDFASDILPGNSQDLENDRNVVKDFFMEKKPEVLEDNAHLPAQSVNFMSWNPQDVSAVDDNLALSWVELPKDYLQKSCLPGAAGTGDEEEISVIHMEAHIGQGPVGFLVLFPNMEEFYHLRRSR